MAGVVHVTSHEVEDHSNAILVLTNHIGFLSKHLDIVLGGALEEETANVVLAHYVPPLNDINCSFIINTTLVLRGRRPRSAVNLWRRLCHRKKSFFLCPLSEMARGPNWHSGCCFRRLGWQQKKKRMFLHQGVIVNRSGTGQCNVRSWMTELNLIVALKERCKKLIW